MWPHLWCDPFPLQARILLALSYSGLAQATTAAANSGTQLIHALSGRQSFTELFPPSAFTFFLFPLLRCLMWEEQADTNVTSTAEQEEFLVSALEHSELCDPLPTGTRSSSTQVWLRGQKAKDRNTNIQRADREHNRSAKLNSGIALEPVTSLTTICFYFFFSLYKVRHEFPHCRAGLHYNQRADGYSTTIFSVLYQWK